MTTLFFTLKKGMLFFCACCTIGILHAQTLEKQSLSQPWRMISEFGEMK